MRVRVSKIIDYGIVGAIISIIVGFSYGIMRKMDWSYYMDTMYLILLAGCVVGLAIGIFIEYMRSLKMNKIKIMGNKKVRGVIEFSLSFCCYYAASKLMDYLKIDYSNYLSLGNFEFLLAFIVMSGTSYIVFKKIMDKLIKKLEDN